MLYQTETQIFTFHQFLRNFVGINFCESSILNNFAGINCVNRHFRGSKKEFIFANFTKILKIRDIFFPLKFLPLRQVSMVYSRVTLRLSTHPNISRFITQGTQLVVPSFRIFFEGSLGGKGNKWQFLQGPANTKNRKSQLTEINEIYLQSF